jgi:hypothetical protein
MVKNSIEFDEIIKKLDELIIKVEALEDKKKDKRVKRVYKVPEDNERCTENKKDGDRCGGRLAKNSKKYCQIHLNKVNGVDPVAAKMSKNSNKDKA